MWRLYDENVESPHCFCFIGFETNRLYHRAVEIRLSCFILQVSSNKKELFTNIAINPLHII